MVAVKYKASPDIVNVLLFEHDVLPKIKRPDIWNPSIHMPRWAARLILEVVNVRVERVQEISCDDAKAEGVDMCDCDQTFDEAHNEYYCRFADVWDSINEKRGYGWEKNPWVFVVEFKMVQPAPCGA